jgi:hypothetical protein
MYLFLKYQQIFEDSLKNTKCNHLNKWHLLSIIPTNGYS